MEDQKHQHKAKPIKQELQDLMQTWQVLIENVKKLKQIVDLNYP